jgi:hypothetical protein
MGSKHLSGQAVDLAGPNIKEFQKWMLANTKLLEELGIYCEDFSATTTWCHCQLVAPKSGKRFFLP